MATHGIVAARAKSIIALAKAEASGEICLDGNAHPDPDQSIKQLANLPGIGPWTAQIYLLMALRRPDVWPSGDLALVRAVRTIKRLRRPPTPARMMAIAEAWRPYRAVAARMLWQHYLAR